VGAEEGDFFSDGDSSARGAAGFADGVAGGFPAAAAGFGAAELGMGFSGGVGIGAGAAGVAFRVDGASDAAGVPVSSASVNFWAQAEHFPVRPRRERSGILKLLPQWGQRTRALVVDITRSK
jgi:hypothetical protein